MKLQILLCVSILGLAKAQNPPQTWQENWYDHNQLLQLHYSDADVAIYFDDDVDPSLTWMNSYLHNVWVYTKNTYGQFGDDQHLYAIFHTDKYGGGHPATYFDELKSYRNVIDCGLNWANAWQPDDQNSWSLTTHEVAHIVELASKGVKDSPAFGIWGDSKWAEIYIYDVLLGVNMQTEADSWRQEKLGTSDNFPRDNTYWFRDWFLPIYTNYGGAAALNKFFELLAQYFPKANTASLNRPQYTRGMNHGEFFHFWSGAAGVNLKPLATTAFGWSDKYEEEFTQAQNDFPDVDY